MMGISLHGYTRIGEFNTIKASTYTGTIDNQQALHALQDALVNRLATINDIPQRGILWFEGSTYTRLYWDPTSSELSKGVIYHMGRRDKPWTGQSCKEDSIKNCTMIYKTGLDNAGYVIEYNNSFPITTSTPATSKTEQGLAQALGL